MFEIHLKVYKFKCKSSFCLMSKSLDLCESAATYGNHSINQDSAHWPMGMKMLRPMNGHLAREP